MLSKKAFTNCRHPELDSGSSRLIKQGFTLVELLVVILIIGILAAVAVPQYKKAVEKSRATQAFAFIQTLAQAQKVYFLANGQYATHFNQLDVSLPLTGEKKWHLAPLSKQTADTKSNDYWTVQLFTDTEFANGIYVVRNSGPYQGAMFVYYFRSTYIPDTPLHKILCREATDTSSASFFFKQPEGSYCQKIMKGTKTNSTFYTLPQ